MSILPGKYQQKLSTYLKAKLQDEEPKESFKFVTSLIENIYDQRSISLIDVACATGGFIYYARKILNICECVGVDVSPELLKQARREMPDVEFVIDSIVDTNVISGRQFDVCTFLTTMSIFDEIEDILGNLLLLVKHGGYLFVFDTVSEDPVDVIMRWRYSTQHEDRCSGWQSAYNVRSVATYERLLRKIDVHLELHWFNFEMPFPIPRTSDLIRGWTIRTEHKDNQIVTGTGQFLNFKVLRIYKP